MPPGFCTQVGPGSGGGLTTVPVLPGDATRVRVPSSPGESSSNGRPVAKARGVDPVMSVPFVQGSLFQQMPVGNMEPMNVMMAQMNQMMQTYYFRPLGMPNTCDRLVDGTIAAVVMKATCAYMHPSQVVMNCFKEPQHAVHAIQALLDSNTPMAALLVDLSKGL